MTEQLSFACDLRYRIYIISWPGYHESAIAIADAIMSSAANPALVITIVYSDHESVVSPIESSQYASIRRPQELFFADKFQACLTDAGEEAILIIHADTACDNWPLLTQQYEKVLSSSLPWGVWSPNISGSPIELSISRITKITGGSLVIVSLIDAVVFALHPHVIARLRTVSFGANLYGWGIDILFCAISRNFGLFNIVDESIKIRHSSGSGYSHQLARQQAKDFFKQFSARELVEAQLLLSHTQLNRIRMKVKFDESL